MMLKCKNCGGELHPAEGAAMCKCMLCGTVQAVPAGSREAGTAPEEAAGRDSTEAAREAERAASLQRWQEEREKREKARQEEERRLADEQRQREKEEHLRKAEEARQKNGSRKIMTYSAAGADRAAAGENAVLVACRKADIIIGPIGIVIADSMFGEITPAMALAVAQADAKRILIPMNHCDNIVAGVPNTSTGALVSGAVEKLAAILQEEE